MAILIILIIAVLLVAAGFRIRRAAHMSLNAWENTRQLGARVRTC